MPLPEILPIQPFTRPVRGEVGLPGSKSITNRALLLAALCDRPVTLTGALFSEDTRIMSEALRRLGFSAAENDETKTASVTGRRGEIPAERAELFVGNAGTAARFLTALCAAAPRGIFTIDGVPQMRKRPMKGLIDALRTLGADIRCLGEEGFFPIEIRSGGLDGGTVEIDAAESSQMLSALLMAAPLARSELRVKLSARVREPFVEMTKQLMRQFGATAVQEGNVIVIAKTSYRFDGTVYPIEPDATAASYFLALPLAVPGGGKLHISRLQAPGNLPELQGDLRFVDVLKKIGVSFVDRGDGMDVEFKPDQRVLRPAPASSLTQDFGDFSDTFLTLAAIAPLLGTTTRITGIAHTRKQETDRVAGAARELKKLGQEVVETEDSLEIHPRALRPGQTIETYRDHRFAMSFAVLGCHDLLGGGRPWLSIRDPACCAKTFPGFFDALDAVRRKSEAP